MKWFGVGKNSPMLTALLVDYAPYDAPHAGNHMTLTDAQALENIEYFNVNKTQRINSLQALVAHYHIDLSPALNGDHYKSVIDELYQWAQNEWCFAVKPPISTRPVWRQTNRCADEIIYSVVMDCAILLGEIVIHHRPAFTWAVDLDSDNLHDQMASARRIVLQAPSLLHPGQQVIVDWEELSVAMLINSQSAANRAINLWQRVANEAISGVTQGKDIDR